MVCIRSATVDDLQAMQQCNLMCLPENYQMKYYVYHGTYHILLYYFITSSKQHQTSSSSFSCVLNLFPHHVYSYARSSFLYTDLTLSLFSLSLTHIINTNVNIIITNKLCYEILAVSWPTLLHVAEDRGKIVGYVLAKLDEESNEIAKGHITSLSVLRTHRKLGIAAKLMIAANDALMTTYKTISCSLHVRVSNKAALHLYCDTLGYENVGTEAAYYADGEDAHNMRLTFKYGLKDQGTTDEEMKVLERLGLLNVSTLS